MKCNSNFLNWNLKKKNDLPDEFSEMTQIKKQEKDWL